jgi:hypothetical protein
MESALANGGFSSSAQYFVKNQLAGASTAAADSDSSRSARAQQLASAITPFLDTQSWYDMAVPLEEIILKPEEHAHAFTQVSNCTRTFRLAVTLFASHFRLISSPFRLNSASSPFRSASSPPHLHLISNADQANLSNEGSPWFRSMVGLFSSPKVRPTRSTLNMASFIGFGGLVSMFHAAQRVRQEQDSKKATEREAAEAAGAPKQQKRRFSPKAEAMISQGIQLVHGNKGRASGSPQSETANIEALTRCLRMVDVIGPVNSTSKAEFTWFKLCEWLQVEVIQVRCL